MAAVKLGNKLEARKNRLLLTIAAPQTVEVFTTFESAEAEEDKYNSIIEKFTTFCSPQKNVTYERYVFQTHIQ